MFRKISTMQGKLIILVIVLITLSAAAVGYLSIQQLYRYGNANSENLRELLIRSQQSQVKDLGDSTYTLISQYNDRIISGELTIEDAQQRALSRISAMRYDNNQGYFWVHSATEPRRPVMVMHPNNPGLNGTDISGINDFDTVDKIFYEGNIYAKHDQIISKNIQPMHLFVRMNEVCLKDGEGFVTYYWTKAGAAKDVGYPKLSYVRLFEPWGWVVGTGFYIDDVDNEVTAANALTQSVVKSAVGKVVLTTIISLLIALFLSLLIISRILKPVKAMVVSVQQIADGDLTQQIKVQSRDEIGVLAGAFNKMVDNLKAMVDDIQKSSGQLASHSQELASSSEEVSATVEEVASTTNEVAATSAQGADNAESAARESKNVQKVAEEGNLSVQETIQQINAIAQVSKDVSSAVQKLGEQSSQIGQIINTITSIADQTNLLALNAAIEAARAGEHGRGFAVVAEEVRKLAEQSAKAAREITNLIKDIQAGVSEAVNAMEHGTAAVNGGVEVAGKAGASLHRIIAAAEKNTDIIQDVAAGSRQVNEGTQQLTAANEQISSAVQQVTSAAQDLAQIANGLQNTVERFKV